MDALALIVGIGAPITISLLLVVAELRELVAAIKRRTPTPLKPPERG